MFWIPDSSHLRQLKLKIGSKLIFEYRLHFFTDLDEYLKLENEVSTEFSVYENEMVNGMVRRDRTSKIIPAQQEGTSNIDSKMLRQDQRTRFISMEKNLNSAYGRSVKKPKSAQEYCDWSGFKALLTSVNGVLNTC